MPWIVGASGMGWHLLRHGRFTAQFRGAVLNRFDNIHVASATAQVARNAAPNLRFSRRWIAAEQRFGTHEHAGRAEAALQSVLHEEAFLYWMQRGTAGESFNSVDVRSVGLHRE